jgi:hypothetical protein
MVGSAPLLFGTLACQGPAATAPTATVPASPPAAAFFTSPHSGHGGSVAAALGPEVQQKIAELRQLLAPFHNLEKATEYGYDTAAPAPGVCLSDPVRGGMGFHYTMSSRDLIGDGQVTLLEPEFIVYSPQSNGGTRLSAVDYFVPYNTWTQAEPPSLLGVPFAREDAFSAYVMHIWAFWPNPAGMFENYNPDVPQCP